jgi:hypothetical protein
MAARTRYLAWSAACVLLAPLAMASDTTADTPAKAAATGAATQWQSFLTPFSADSLWNARPLAPVFGSFVIPKSSYYPSVSNGIYSTAAFAAKDSDGPVVVSGWHGKPGVRDADTETERPVTIPHWPADLVPASGSDGHADIVDTSTGIIHSFWQLKKEDGKWVAAQYAWTRLDGRGWGDPAHYMQGARAAGVATTAGIIRRQEVNDGAAYYRHALAMSLTFNGLAASPAYIYPATSADTNAATTNTGQIPEGALLMLPPSYDTSHIAHPALRKVAETLKRYGAYVVDRNFGTPYVIYVENGVPFNLHAGGWNNAVANELDLIRANLRQVVSAKGWVDGDGKPFVPQRHFNLLSMRGTWRGPEGAGQYDSWAQAVVFGATEKPVTLINLRARPSQTAWALPKAGADCRMTARAKGGAKLRLVLHGGDYASVLFDSGELADGQSKQLSCPAAGASVELQAISGVGAASSVSAELFDAAD